MSILLFISLFFSIQDYTPAFELDGSVDLIYRDNLDNLYLVNDYTIKKYSPKGELMFSYSDNYLGKISSLSIGEGLKVLVYYQNNAQIVVLDNSLSQLTPAVALNFYNLGRVSLVCSSSQNRYWFFDPMQGALIRTTNTFSEVYNSGNLNQLLGFEITPNLMTEWGNTLYLNDPKQGILVFDIFGSYKKTIPLKNIDNFQISENGIFFMEKNAFFFYDFTSFIIQEIKLPRSDANKALISNKMLYILTDYSVNAFNRNTL